MMSVSLSKSVVLMAVVGIVACGWILLAAIHPAGGPNSLSGNLIVGLVLGTIFGQTSLAAAWCALGPFSLVRRLPLSFAWLAGIVISFGCNIAREPNPNGLAVLSVYGGAVLAQWLLVQTPIWLFVARYDLRVSFGDDMQLATNRRDRQFGIRQVMILTTLVAVVLGLGRLLLGGLKTDEPFKDWKGVAIFAFLTFSNAVISLPLIAAVLLGRKTLLATFVALLLVAFATVIELPLLFMLVPGPGGGSNDYWIFLLINVFQCAWILSVLLILRSGGFRLTSRADSQAASGEL